MFRKIVIFISVITLVFSSYPVFAESSESPAVQDEDRNSSLLSPSEGIEIPVFTEENMKKFDIPDNDAMMFISELKTGWNLGNTFDAQDEGTGVKGRDYETYWSRAKTTKKLIHALKEAGFNLIRIPVSWHNHVSGEDYMIDAAWMSRIHEVAEWVCDEGMYFIINVHHDNSKKFFYPDSSHYEQSEKYLVSVWTQVAEAFADFDEHCILESMNEPRLVGNKTYEWYLNEAASECQDAADCINRLNQKFVDIVRSSGGNNSNRYLLVPGYCASPEGAVSSLFRIPEDSADNRIIIEVHAYRPYNFALNLKSTDDTFLLNDTGKKGDIASFMNNLYNRFIKKGIPVIIDEYGALKKGTNVQDRVNLAAYYVASASARGITCCWWDNHAFSGTGENFGLIDRNKSEWKYPDIVLAIMQNCMCNRE